jgi:hypothetical protein
VSLSFAERAARNDARHAAAVERNRLAAERAALLLPASQDQDGTAGRQVLSHPLAAHAGNRVTPEIARQATGDLAALGRQLWTELHRWALAWDGNRATAREWLGAFRRRIPQVGCSCRAGWDDAIRANPPDLDRPAELFAWSVLVHNAVNRTLGKPEVSLEEARRTWSPAP